MEKTFETKFGKVRLRNVMIDTNGTDLVDGIDVYLDDKWVKDRWGYFDLEEMTIEEVEELIENC